MERFKIEIDVDRNIVANIIRTAVKLRNQLPVISEKIGI